MAFGFQNLRGSLKGMSGGSTGLLVLRSWERWLPVGSAESCSLLPSSVRKHVGLWTRALRVVVKNWTDVHCLTVGGRKNKRAACISASKALGDSSEENSSIHSDYL